MEKIGVEFGIMMPFIWLFLLRVSCITIGVVSFIHFHLMAVALPQKTCWVMTGLVSSLSGIGVLLIISGLFGNPSMMLLASVLLGILLIGWAMWLWSHGFHVSKFISDLTAK